MQPYPRSPHLVWPGHLHGTGCLSARAVGTGFSYCCAAFVFGSGWRLGVGFVNPASPGWGLGWVCLGTVCGVVPLVSAVCGVRGWASVSACFWNVCGFVGAPLAPRCFRFRRAVWACVLGPGLGCAQPFLAVFSGCVFCAFCFLFFSRALWSLSLHCLSFGLGWWLSGEPGPGPSTVPSEPLHGPVDVAEDSMEGLQSAFRALSVKEVDTHPVKRKRERGKDAGECIADEGADQGHDPTNDPTFEGAPSASGLHASPTPIITTPPTPDPAAATSTPITNPPMAEDTGFTGMPTYPAYGMNPPTTAFPEATTTSEPVTSSSAPRWYAADYHHPLPATGAYVDVPGYAALSGWRRGPESCGSRSRGSGRSSNSSMTRSEINEVLRGATSKIVGDLTQEIRDKLEPLIPPQASPTTVGMSPHQVQANHLVAGLTNTLGSLRSRPMPTPAVIPRSPFVPRTAQPPYSEAGHNPM